MVSTLSSNMSPAYFIMGHGSELSRKQSIFEPHHHFMFVVKAKCGQVRWSDQRLYRMQTIFRKYGESYFSGPITNRKVDEIRQLLGRSEFYRHGKDHTNHKISLMMYDSTNKYKVDVDFNGIIPFSERFFESRRFKEFYYYKKSFHAMDIPKESDSYKKVESDIKSLFRFAIYPSQKDLDDFFKEQQIKYTNGTQYYKDIIDKLHDSALINTSFSEIQNIISILTLKGGIFYFDACRSVHHPKLNNDLNDLFTKRKDKAGRTKTIIPRHRLYNAIKNPLRYDPLMDIVIGQYEDHGNGLGVNSNDQVLSEMSNENTGYINNYDSNVHYTPKKQGKTRRRLKRQSVGKKSHKPQNTSHQNTSYRNTNYQNTSYRKNNEYYGNNEMNV